MCTASTPHCVQAVFSYWSCEVIDDKIYNMIEFELECLGGEHMAISALFGIPTVLM